MTNRILDDLVAAIAPRRMTVVTDWLVRGGIHTVVEASHPRRERPAATAVQTVPRLLPMRSTPKRR